VRQVRVYAPVPFALDADFGVADLPEAAPPMWNVRMVSCVPGSPIDCAAMMPTAVAELGEAGSSPG
jgi:hypothetical protein